MNARELDALTKDLPKGVLPEWLRVMACGCGCDSMWWSGHGRRIEADVAMAIVEAACVRWLRTRTRVAMTERQNGDCSEVSIRIGDDEPDDWQCPGADNTWVDDYCSRWATFEKATSLHSLVAACKAVG